jgi:predicted methyltransferase
MTLHYEDGGLRLFHGSNKDILPTFADASFDSIVTDPPYELGFMGKAWDSSGIAYDVDLWREAYRVLKPGGYLLSFGGTRTWHRIAAAIEDAGFEIRDSIAWMYGSGFPKSMDVSKAVEATVTTGGSHSTQKRRAVMGDDYAPSAADGTFRKVESSMDNVRTTPPVFEATTDEARAWAGWGTALKPAFEPIVVARKPLSGTVAANVLAHGTGALNIDACRVETTEDLSGGAYAKNGGRSVSGSLSPTGMNREGATAHGEFVQPSGRFPSNVLLDDSQAVALDEQTGLLRSGTMRAGTRKRSTGGAVYGADTREIVSGDTYGDSGGASRFFPVFRYEAKAPGTERPSVDGVAHATVKPLELMRWLVRLVTRRGGHVLDLFAGSGTTGEAALLEGMLCTLIEIEAAHIPLILVRVRKPQQVSLFGDWEASTA